MTIQPEKQNSAPRLGAANVIAAGSAIAGLASLSIFIYEPSLWALGSTVTAVAGYTAARQYAIHSAPHDNYEP